MLISINRVVTERGMLQKPKLKICGSLFIDFIRLGKQTLMYSSSIQSTLIVNSKRNKI